MIKIAGALLVVVSCSLIGVSYADKLRLRVSFLRGMVNALEVMRSEICSDLRQLPDVMLQLSKNENNPASVFFRDCRELFQKEELPVYREAWISAAEDAVKYGLKADECETLAQLGEVMGRYDAGEQEKSIERTKKNFEKYLERAEEDKKKQFRIRTALGVGSGLIIAILMI